MAYSYLEEYDHIYVTVRRDKLDELVYCYEQFGWVEEERQEHKVYENLLDMTFRRPHRIADKDELQLLQVHLDEALNAVGKYEKAPRRQTKAFCVCLGILAFLLIALGLPLGIVPVTVGYKVLGYIMAAVGVIIVPLVCVFGVKLWHYEKKVADRRLKIARDLCIGICYNARQIRERGGKILASTLEPAREMVKRIAKKSSTEDEEEELLARVMDISLKKAIAERNAYAKEHEEAEEAEAAAASAAAAAQAAPAEPAAPAETVETAVTDVTAATDDTADNSAPGVVVIREGDSVIIMEPAGVQAEGAVQADAVQEGEPAKEAGDE